MPSKSRPYTKPFYSPRVHPYSRITLNTKSLFERFQGDLAAFCNSNNFGLDENIYLLAYIKKMGDPSPRKVSLLVFRLHSSLTKSNFRRFVMPFKSAIHTLWIFCKFSINIYENERSR